MTLVARGDIAAFDDLVRRHWGPLCAYAGRILNDRDAGEDVAQTTFVRLWQRRSDWRGGSVRNYLLLLARNLCFDDIRYANVRARLSHRTREAFASPVTTPGDRLDAREVQAAIDRAVQELPPRRREAFILVHIQGLSYQEAAHVMGVARATVSNQIVAALEQLRSRLRGLL
jgi:RNA polymerase sigma-70 factor (ECF subfamily)